VKEFLNKKEAGELLGRSPGAMSNLVLRRKIPFRKPAGRLVFLRSQLVAWINNAPGVSLEEIQDEGGEPQ